MGVSETVWWHTNAMKYSMTPEPGDTEPSVQHSSQEVCASLSRVFYLPSEMDLCFPQQFLYILPLPQLQRRFVMALLAWRFATARPRWTEVSAGGEPRPTSD